jgi:thiol-disulfide isomerase/thioredoxin
MRIYQKDT